MGALWAHYKRLPGWVSLIVGLVLGLAIGAGGAEDDGDTVTATNVTGAETTTTNATTTTTEETADDLPDGEDAVVGRIIDGDTFETADGTTVRLIGIDSPETADPRVGVQCFGQEAADRAEELIGAGTRVRLVSDVEGTDSFGRDLAYVYRSEDGLFVNEALVEEGFAMVATFPPNVAHVGDFRAAQTAAREDGAGLWNDCAAPPTTTAPTTAPPTTAAPPQPPAPLPFVPPTPSSGSFANCTEAREAGAAPVFRGDPGYGSHLDRDNDGVGCET